MKNLILATLLSLAFVMPASAEKLVRSSFTQTSDTAYIDAEQLVGVVVGVATAGGTLVIVSSSFTFSGTVVSSISLATAGTHDFQDTQVKGIYYRTNAATNGVTIIYRK